MFDLNKKVKYENLAPSLQEMLGGYREGIEELLTKIENVDNNTATLQPEVDKLNTKVENLSAEVKDEFTTLETKVNAMSGGNITIGSNGAAVDPSNATNTTKIANGKHGQFTTIEKSSTDAYINPVEVFKDSLFAMTVNQTEFDRITKNGTASGGSSTTTTTTTNNFSATEFLKDIKTKWETIEHFDQNAANVLGGKIEGSVTEGQVLTNKPLPSSTVKYFGGNSFTLTRYTGGALIGVISDKVVPQNLQMNLDMAVFKDDGQLAIIIGYMKDATGREHTLSLVRAFGDKYTGKPPIKIAWALVYDMCNPTQYIVMDTANATAIDIFNNNKGSISKYKKYDGGMIEEISFVKFGNTQIDFNTTATIKTETGWDRAYHSSLGLSFYMPTMKPPSWSQEMYDNIKQMLTSSRLGFACRINSVAVHINPKYTFSFETVTKTTYKDYYYDGKKLTNVYRLDTNEEYVYKNGSWTKIGPISSLSNDSYYYDSILDRFVYFKKKSQGSDPIEYTIL